MVSLLLLLPPCMGRGSQPPGGMHEGDSPLPMAVALLIAAIVVGLGRRGWEAVLWGGWGVVCCVGGSVCVCVCVQHGSAGGSHMQYMKLDLDPVCARTGLPPHLR